MTEAIALREADALPFDKLKWQRRKRREFRERLGFSDAANYATAKRRLDVLQRDSFRCVRCGMTDREHKARWNRPITVDHIDRNRSNNTMENLQTLCLRCHGNKDLSEKLRTPIVPNHKEFIIRQRAMGTPYQHIADDLGFSIASIWKWYQRWNTEEIA